MVAYNGPAVVPPVGPGPLTSYTPTVSAGSGTITTSSATGGYFQWGKLCFVQIAVTITTNGTGASWVIASLPAGITAAAKRFIWAGRASAVSFKMLQGFVDVSATQVLIFNYDNTYPAANGEVLNVSGWIETT